MQVSDLTKRRLTIAKEMYSHGYVHAMKKSPSDAILSILNFDYCLETILKTALLDANVTLSRNVHGRTNPKSFDDLIDDLRRLYPNFGYTPEALSLHKLRNDVQHQGQIPSQHEVDRHVITVRSFFDELCLKAYDGTITFADVSLALFVSSEVEKIVLEHMEKAFGEGRFTDSVFYARRAVAYHVALLRNAMDVPQSFGYFSLHDLNRAGLGAISKAIEETDNKIEWVIDRLCLREYYDDIISFMGGSRMLRYGLRSWDSERKEANQDEGEKARVIAYNFITRTQDLVRRPDAEDPFVFDLMILEMHDDECTVQIGLASKDRLVKAKLTLSKLAMSDGQETVQDISTQTGLQIVKLKGLAKGIDYSLVVSATTEKDGRNDEYLTFKL